MPTVTRLVTGSQLREQSPAIELDTLDNIPLFQNLAVEQLARLKGCLSQQTYPAGTILITAELPGDGAYIVLEGTVKVHVDQPNGQSVILSILGPGQIIGEMSLADSLDCSATVVTLEESRVLWIGRDDFQHHLGTMPELARNVVQILSSRLRLANAQIQSLAALDVPGRVARQILAFANEYGRHAPSGDVLIPIRLTQDDLAALVGATRVHVNRVMASYKRRGLLSVDQCHYIAVHSAADLARCCE